MAECPLVLTIYNQKQNVFMNITVNASQLKLIYICYNHTISIYFFTSLIVLVLKHLSRSQKHQNHQSFYSESDVKHVSNPYVHQAIMQHYKKNLQLVYSSQRHPLTGKNLLLLCHFQLQGHFISCIFHIKNNQSKQFTLKRKETESSFSKENNLYIN